MEVFIEAAGVQARVQGYPVIRSVDLRIPLGRTTFVLGPSGSGKSTLVKVLAGLTFPDEGTVRCLGKDYRDMSALEDRIFRKSASFVFQDGALWANQSVYQNLFIPLRHHEPWLQDDEVRYRIKSALDMVGFTDDPSVRPAALSTGEQKLVAFARALVTEPQILFMDEPTSFIDEAGETRLHRILQRLAREGKTMVAVGNMYDLAFRIADHICIMNEGEVYRMASVYDIVDQWPSFLAPIQARHRKILDRRNQGAGGEEG